MFIIFDQNNSGGYFHINDNEAPMVVIEGDSFKEIMDKADEILDNSDSCPCCGDRWYLDYIDESDMTDNWRDKVSFTMFRTSIILHKKDGSKYKYTDNKTDRRMFDFSATLDVYDDFTEECVSNK